MLLGKVWMMDIQGLAEMLAKMKPKTLKALELYEKTETAGEMPKLPDGTTAQAGIKEMTIYHEQCGRLIFALKRLEGEATTRDIAEYGL